jgi:drug/metabolite transporter (DMT)-like permease
MAGEGLLQQGAASKGPRTEDSRQMFSRLVRDKRWWAGLGSAAGGYGFQALALAFGPLALVQPLIVSEMLFAIPISARRRGVHLDPRAWISAVGVVAGLGLGIGFAQPRQGDPLAPGIAEWAWALGGTAVITAGSIGLTRIVSGAARASLYALAGAIMLALQSALFDTSIQLLKQHQLAVFAYWQAYALIGVSFAGLSLIQRAYKAGPLPASLPIIDAVLPIGAVALGLGLFHEMINTRWWALAGAGLGVAMLVGGIIGLDTSPAVRKQQLVEDQNQRDEAAENSRICHGHPSVRSGHDQRQRK